MRENPKVMKELRQARQEELAGKFQPWKPRCAAWPTESKQARGRRFKQDRSQSGKKVGRCDLGVEASFLCCFATI